MHKTSRVAALLILAVAASMVLGCSLIPQGISGFFATKTPTSTATPTATPIPPVSIIACAFQNDCYVENLQSFYGGEFNPGPQVYVQFPYNTPVRINLAWIARDQQHLDNNLQHLKFFFKIDGISYTNDSMFKNGVSYDDAGNPTDNPGLFMGVALSGWKVGYPHTIEYGYVIDSLINDGWDDFQPQTVTYSIMAMPLMLPTSTPTSTLAPTSTETPIPTATKTPRPIIYTPRPTAIPVEPTSQCSVDSTIAITNSTGGQVTLYLSGPVKYTFYLATGDTTLNVCSGAYSYTAYGCGGANDSGEIDANTAHEFYCQ